MSDTADGTEFFDGAYPDETDDQANARVHWCRRHQHVSEVALWSVGNPPPSDWTGTPLEYAYLEMVWYSW